MEEAVAAGEKPIRSSGSQRSLVIRSVQSGDNRGLGGNFRLVFQFKL